jgi:hypothetical protein
MVSGAITSSTLTQASPTALAQVVELLKTRSHFGPTELKL